MKQPLSYIHPNAKIAKNVVIEPFTSIDGDVEIGEGSWIGSNVSVMDGARIGKNCNIYPGAVISANPQDLKYNNEKTFVEIGDNFKSDKTILNVNPLGRVPMVETPNGEYLIESMAIVYHFIERESQLIPDTKNGITDFHQIMAFMSSSIYPAILLYFHPDHYVSNENTEDLVNRSKSILETYLNYLENKIGEYIVGNLSLIHI